MDRRTFLSSVGAAALASAVPISSSMVGSPAVITLPPVQFGLAFTIQNLGSVPLVIQAPRETISLDPLDTWQTK